MIMEKFVNIPIVQKKIINIFKDSAVKTIKTSANNHCNNHRKKCSNAKCIKLPNYKYKENECENMRNISRFLNFKDNLKSVSLEIRFWKVEGNYI